MWTPGSSLQFTRVISSQIRNGPPCWDRASICAGSSTVRDKGPENRAFTMDSDDDFVKPKARPKKAAAAKKRGKKKAKAKGKGKGGGGGGMRAVKQDLALAALTDPQHMFNDMMAKVGRETCVGVARRLGGRPLRVGTMCSGTEAPVMALDMAAKAIHKLFGARIEVDHVFSSEIEPKKQSYIERNFQPPLLFRDIREMASGRACTAYGALHDVPGNLDLLVAGTSCVDNSTMNRPSC